VPYRAIDRPLGGVGGFQELGRLDRTSRDRVFFYIERLTDLVLPRSLHSFTPRLLLPHLLLILISYLTVDYGTE
jgi:hypothetical protein